MIILSSTYSAGEPVRYNKQSLVNGGFVVGGDSVLSIDDVYQG
jgi:hypothetical protein